LLSSPSLVSLPTEQFSVNFFSLDLSFWPSGGMADWVVDDVIAKCGDRPNPYPLVIDYSMGENQNEVNHKN
jgi:hypothetical protein